MTRHFNWYIISAIVASLVLLPLLTLTWLSASANSELWGHLANTVLADYVVSSLSLMLGVALLTSLLGIGSALLVTQYHFKGVNFFHWALLLPLAMPAYITAYSYTGLLDVAGPIQSLLRTHFELSYGQYWFPEIRSLGGAIFVLSFVLYPYVYLMARASFMEQSQHLREVAQLLGYSRRKAFFRITLPIARPAIIAGISLALMETLADFGAVSYFGVNSFTTGIFRTWYGLDSVEGAAQLAMILLSFVVVLLALEKSSRKRAAYHGKKTAKPGQTEHLSGKKQALAIALVCTPLLLGFIIPCAQLSYWAIKNIEQLASAEFWQLVANTLLLASITACVALFLALLVAYSHRLNQSKFTSISKGIIGLGYAIPGLVIAVGVLIPLAYFDNTLDGWLRSNFNYSSGLLISGTIAALVIAYLVRFLAVALKSVDSGLGSIHPNMDQAARSLGLSPFGVLRKIHLPIMKGSILTGLLIVFVDVMKELPATLVLRPFNFNTLAVRAYELASDERLADAALPSIAIVLVGLLPVILLSRVSRISNISPVARISSVSPKTSAA
ncbi:MAG: iron(III) transport system permease protein [Arenicella sp.]|jgi:iron(III) transport system permease protein